MPHIKKLFCLRGHNSLLVGRDKQYSCNQCAKDDLPLINRRPKTRFSQSRFTAKRRNIIWELSYIEFCVLISNSCYYCNNSLPETSCGLDRIDNSKGYILSNVRPCCKRCNVMKNNLTEEQFMIHLKQIFNTWKVLS